MDCFVTTFRVKPITTLIVDVPHKRWFKSNLVKKKTEQNELIHMYGSTGAIVPTFYEATELSRSPLPTKYPVRRGLAPDISRAAAS